MKRILGIDLGATSIGWSIIDIAEDTKHSIVDMGSRIVPLNTDDQNEFTKGNAISKNQGRTTMRTARKLLDRYQLRRFYLMEFLKQHQMVPGEALVQLNSLELYKLRDKALSEPLTLPELGRVLLHLNQRRGYKSMRGEATKDKQETEYVAEVLSRHQKIKQDGITIGQYFFKMLTEQPGYTIKNKVFPREAYLEEFDRIMSAQQPYHAILKDATIDTLRNKIIYFQRNLKSQKSLVSLCELESFRIHEKKDIMAGPRVAPRSSPLFQIEKIWESINTINIRNKSNEVLQISLEQKHQLFQALNETERLTQDRLFKLLGISKHEWSANKLIEKGLQGNTTRSAIKKIIESAEQDYSHLLQFEVKMDESVLINPQTGELLPVVSPDIEKEPLYRLWHVLYSISNQEECVAALMNQFNIDHATATQLAALDFKKAGFGNKSVKAMRKLLPGLMQGLVYSEAATRVGYNHSKSLTKDENLNRQLLDQLPILKKNSLRQPIVEKILNQMINLVNQILQEYGRPDEIVIELARELRQSKEERNETFSAMNKRERENEKIAERLKELNLRSTRNNIIKYRLFEEIKQLDDVRTNAICIYCGKSFGLSQAMNGEEVDVEHIIPRSLYFDDSQSNKTLSHQRCNRDKGNQTALDFMSGKSNMELQLYLERVDDLYKRKIIGRGKRNKLLMKGKDIPQDFIERQLNESRYISRKALEILHQICHSVYATGGGVTAYLRNIWGYNEVLMNLQLPKYRELGLTEWKEIERVDGSRERIEFIKDWTKRDDHRHHAIDALIIACTRRGFIQRINTLNASETRTEIKGYLDENKLYDARKSLLENYFYAQKPFTTKEVEKHTAGILVSFKQGKRVATRTYYKAKGTNQHKGVIVPRGSLSEESIYGRIKLTEIKPLKYLLENPELIFKPYIKALVQQRLNEHAGDSKKAFASAKKQPIIINEEKGTVLEFGRCFRDEYIIRYKLGPDFNKVDKIVDEGIKKIVQERLKASQNDPKQAFKDLENNPIWLNKEKGISVKSVRCRTGLSAVEPIRNGFVKPGSNHHIAIYQDEEGRYQEHVCTFWHAVERKKYDMPVIIKEPGKLWDQIIQTAKEYPQNFLDKLPGQNWKLVLSMQQNEMFVMGLSVEEMKETLESNNNTQLSRYLYRVQKISESDYVFRHHLETKLDDSDLAMKAARYYRKKSIKSLLSSNPLKVYISNTGQLSVL